MSIQFYVHFTIPESEKTEKRDDWRKKVGMNILPSTDYGWDVIDSVRHELNLDNLPLSVFPQSVNPLEYNPKLNLDERDARHVSHFSSISDVTVTMSLKHLKNYLSIKPRTTTDNKGGVKCLTLHWELDEDILEDWIEAGCPLEWEQLTDNDEAEDDEAEDE